MSEVSATAETWPPITTLEEYDAAQREWLACEYFVGVAGPEYGPNWRDEVKRAVDRQLAIEKAQNAAPFDFDDDGNVIPNPH